MAKASTIVGIDIGSSNVRTVVAQDPRDGGSLRVVGVGIVPAFGIRRGIITDNAEVQKAVSQSIEKAEAMSGLSVKKALVNIGGAEVALQESRGVVAVGRADGEVADDDISRVIGESQAIPLPMNKEIVHIIPRSYRLDDQEDLKNPIGMKGVRLEVETLIVQTSSTHIKNLVNSVGQAGVDVEDIVLEPLAASKSVLSKKQKELGAVLINIGGGTTSIAVFEEGEVLHTSIIPAGAGHITNDIAIGLRSSIEVAEKVKLEYGTANLTEVNRNEEIDLEKIDSSEEGVVSRYHVAEIIEARLTEIFELVQKELESIGKAGLLPSGAVLVGGGAKMPGSVELAKKVLGLPSKIGFPEDFEGVLDKFDDPSFATAAGLVLWGREHEGEFSLPTQGGKVMETLSKGTEYTVDTVRGWMRKFLP